ncbi:MAG: glycerol-3-phosphate 1-O-acyltransferase PlsY [Micavibrio aeruginosavorus]|uniref:Glycerol-3-phosphate acyltransferase n=1 Tax=Micavibrio aeruginosavorus TaxID=349221 RepID=A0A7T5R263_9BACT|nr:MAG: glycerol-3-phosphate 1-O-acyltransferase PlsY [Micavibrio aeruginosavorus]
MDIIIMSVLAYLLGSLPFGLVLTRMAGYGDIRQIGSGNIGATNVLRTGNRKLALATLLLDGGKGALAVGLTALAARTFPGHITEPALYAAGLFSTLGHCFPVWLKFKGGKGVATALGMFLALAPLTGIAACVTWLLMAALFRISSLAALMAMLSTPLSAYVIYKDPLLATMSFFVAGLVWYRHKANIQRLIKGEEPKIGKKKESL